jgi:subtilisin family serine protease
MSEFKEYIATLKTHIDLNRFYDDMETPGGDLYIPERAVEVANRRPNSRNTHYLLTDEEAKLLRGDPRVLAVELTPKNLGLVAKPLYERTSNYWDKSDDNSAVQTNWGLLRVFEGEQRSNWGSDGIANQTGTVKINATGKNVDIVIVDGHIDPVHPEFAVNVDGTGGTRLVQYNWFQYNPKILGKPASTYLYMPYVNQNNFGASEDNDHGSHVAGTAAGNTQGWAKDANIYNINPYASNPNQFDSLYIYDYIREFHKNKPINPTTKNKKPTILNNSWGYFYEIPIASIVRVNYRGNVVLRDAAITKHSLESYGILSKGGIVIVPSRYYALDADIEDAIEDGIIVVGAAGNNSTKIDISGGVDIDNYFLFDNNGEISPAYYHEGASPGSSPGVITVGAISAFADERKADYSNCGPRVDVYAPGSCIISSINSNQGVPDSRNTNFNLIKFSGTSMASPQVTGVLACLLELTPQLTQTQAYEYIINNAKLKQITDSGGSYTDVYSLQGSTNRFLFCGDKLKYG